MGEEIKMAGKAFVAMGLFFFGWTDLLIPAVFVGVGILTIIFSNEYNL